MHGSHQGRLLLCAWSFPLRARQIWDSFHGTFALTFRGLFLINFHLGFLRFRRVVGRVLGLLLGPPKFGEAGLLRRGWFSGLGHFEEFALR